MSESWGPGNRTGEQVSELRNMQRARMGFRELSRDLQRNSRRELGLLDEQILLLGASCPGELAKARDDIATIAQRMNRTLEDYDANLSAWSRSAFHK